MISKKTQQEVTEYISGRFNQKAYEWHDTNRFVDECGCHGYIFKNERAARRYVLSDIHEYGSECESASPDETWISIMVGTGMTLRGATNLIKRGDWENVARRMLNACGPSYFLSTYSGQVATLDNGSLLYY